jgi:hypothetical protein
MSEAIDSDEDLRAAKLAARAERRKQLKERGERLRAEQAAESKARMARAIREHGLVPPRHWSNRPAAKKY